MRIGFPHMGNFYIAFEALLKNLGFEVVVPPRPTKRSIEMGVKESPEFGCFPMKATLGDLILVLEKGVDILCWFEGAWSCRFGYYGRLHHQILQDKGYRFESMIFDAGGAFKALKSVKRRINLSLLRLGKAIRVAWYKSRLVHLTETLALRSRPYEISQKETTMVTNKALNMIRETDEPRRLNRLEHEIISSFHSIPKDRERRPLKIWLVGEIYMVLEPEANFHLIEYLGEHGVLVTPFTTIHNWTFRSIGAGKREEERVRRLALPYLPYPLGGEEQLSLGYTILAKRLGYDGVIHLRPFTCMTETVAHSILHKISKEYGIPLLSLSLDEHTEDVGFFTRIEAFLDLLYHNHKKKTPLPHKGSDLRGSLLG